MYKMDDKKDDGHQSDIYERVTKTLKSLTEAEVPKIPGGYKTSNNMNHNSIQSATEDLSCAYILKILESNLRRRDSIEKYQVKLEQMIQLKNRLANLPENICAFLNIGNVMAFYKELTCHPPFIVDLKNLTCLDFVRAKIKSIPKDIDYFDKLIHLNVCGNGLSSLPVTIGNLSKLESLDISLNELTSIPETFGNLENLKFFDAHCNELNSIPECIGKLKNLIELDLSQNYIDNIPETCGNLLKLRRFDVSYNNLTTLPQTIGNMNGLTELEMSRSKLKTIPESKTIGNLSSLAFLRAICNQLINLPDTIGDMINLSSLELSRNNLTSIPEAIGNLINLENLDVSDNQIAELPKTLWNLKKLKQLDVACNKLSSISEEIGNLTNLESLIINHNQITSLPSSVGELKRLKFLRIHCNDLSAIPETIGNLENLIRLNADANNISTVPTTIGKLQKLELLYLCSNSIRCIPKEISDCKSLREINFDDNIYLESVPVRMSNLPNLLFLSVDRCKLRCLPALLSSQLKEVRVFKNTQITHIPIIYEKFFDDYDNIEVCKRDRLNPSYFNIKELENDSYLLLPFGTKKVFNTKENIPFSLLELALQASCKLPDNNITRRMINYLPYVLKNLIEKGPIAQCSYIDCDKKLCTEYFLLIVKRLQHESELLFSCNFCSITCTVQWLECNERKYNVVEWKVVQ